MSVKPQWKIKFDELKGYIASNTDIYIDKREISIPEQLRIKFYEHFDDIRNTFVRDFIDSLPVDVETLSRNYIQSEKEIINCLKIERLDLPVDLMSFLHNPKEGMVRWLYNRLFELIQQKITMEEFENMAENDLVSTAKIMYRLGYEAWAALTIIIMLEPDETLSVELDDNFEPVTGELKEIAFGRQFNHSTKRIPEFVIHSKKTGSYIAVKMPLAKEISAYYPPHEVPQKMMRDRTGDTSYVLDSRVMFLSILNDLSAIPVYAEVHERRIKSPDVMIEFLTLDELTDPSIMSQVKNRLNIMRPNLVKEIVAIETGTLSDQIPDHEGINICKAGFEQAKLQPVIDSFLKPSEVV